MATSEQCPECGATDYFVHCYAGCGAKEHLVTCNQCKTPFAIDTVTLNLYMTVV